ncbi:hypothetical protein BGZ93_001837 [Podila epicladia]|nr:hypothetical protein BGZ92_006912 [Podila epicladia]KAG0100374.1 hypothetical protein BGZ93_001837 [Podila epicladia]
MKIQVSAIVGPIFLLSLAARSILAEGTSPTENVSAFSSSPDLIADIKQHTQLDRGLNTAVEPEETIEVGGEDEAFEEDEYYDEDDDDEDYDEYDDEYDDDEEVDEEDEDQDADEYAEYDEDKPYAEDEDIKLNEDDLEAYIDAASQETEERENIDSSTQTEEANVGSHPTKEDPLTESSSTCKSGAQSSLHKRYNAPDTPTGHDVSALATAEPGGACIDSFVNFALRFQEHCSIFCLKTFTHIFAKPNVLGVLDCFGCSNFVIQGFIALGKDCAGLFSSDPMTPEDIRRAREAKATSVGAPAPTGGVKSKSEKAIAGQDLNGSQLRGAEPLILNNVISSLQTVDMGQVHEWLEVGKGIVSVINAGAKNNQAEEEQQQQQPQSPQGEILVETQAGEQGQVRAQANEKQKHPKVDKDEFNEYIIKAAKFANWDLTPKMIDDSGIYDRVHDSGIF